MRRSLGAVAVPLGVAFAAVALQLGATLVGQLHGYGYFIDELYYIACARRLDFGYVDHPPLAPAILRLIWRSSEIRWSLSGFRAP